MIEYSYQIDPRPANLGGCWRLRLLESGEEVGGGVFPLSGYIKTRNIKTRHQAGKNRESESRVIFEICNLLIVGQGARGGFRLSKTAGFEFFSRGGPVHTILFLSA